MPRATRLLAVMGFLLLLASVAGRGLGLPVDDTKMTALQRIEVVSLLGIAGVVYLCACYAVLRDGTTRHGVLIVVGFAVALRLVFLFAHPVLSSDIYRYVWDGQVQRAGINPYRYIPDAPALAFLRDHAIFPHINRADYAHTIYPPMAELVFAVTGRLSDSVVGMKLAMLLFDGLAIWCLMQVLAIAGLPRERVLIYAWNPLVQWSFAYDGHIDAVAIGLLGLALLLRARGRSGWAGAILGAATLVKFFPVVVAPAFVRGSRFWRPALAGLVVIAGLYGLYSSVGTRVFGFMEGYTAEEGLNSGEGFWLLSPLNALNDHTDLVDLPANFGKDYLAVATAAMALLALWIARGTLKTGESDAVRLCADASILAAATMVIISPHYPWYFAWLALPCAVAPRPSILWLSVAPLILYLHPGYDLTLWGSFIYGPAFALAAYELRTRRSSVRLLQPLSRG